MSHFYASIPVSARKTVATARGHKSTGLVVDAASWEGKVETRTYHDDASGHDLFEVWLKPHHGAGVTKLLARGRIDGSEIEGLIDPAIDAMTDDELLDELTA